MNTDKEDASLAKSAKLAKGEGEWFLYQPLFKDLRLGIVEGGGPKPLFQAAFPRLRT